MTNDSQNTTNYSDSSGSPILSSDALSSVPAPLQEGGEALPENTEAHGFSSESPAEVAYAETGRKEEKAVPDEAGRPGFIKRAWRWWINPQSKFGRFNRRALKFLALAVIFLMMGAGLFWYFLYRPAAVSMKMQQAEMISLQETNTLLQKELTAQHDQATRLTAELESATTELDGVAGHMDLLRVMGDMMEANYNIAQKDLYSARKNLEAAQKRFTKMGPFIQGKEPELFHSVAGRLQQAIADLKVNTQNTATDVMLMVDQLKEFEKQVWGNPD